MKAWNGKSEVENMAELEEEGFEETWYACKLCGTNLMERETTIEEGCVQIDLSCPYCGWGETEYDC